MTVFAEIREMRKLEEEWSQSDWGTALSSLLIGRADQPGSGDAALMPLAEILGINDPVEARRVLFGRQAAVALPNWADLAHGVLLAAPEDIKPIEDALGRRKLAPEPVGQARQYTLDAHGHCLATNGHVFVLGQRLGPASPYERSLQLLAGGAAASLESDERFRRELAAVGAGPHRAILYFADADPPPATQPVPASAPTTTAADTRPATASAPATPPATHPAATRSAATQPARRFPQRWWPASWPTLVRGAAALSVDGRVLSLAIQGQLDQPAPQHLQDANVAVLNALPATTLAAWAQAINLASHYRALSEAEPSVLSLYLAYVDMRMKAAGTSLGDGLLAHLGLDTIVLLGVIPAAEQTVKAGFDLPALGLIVAANHPAPVAQALDLVGESVASIVNFPGLQTKLKEPVRVRKVPFENTTISELNLGEFFRTQTGCPYAHTIGLSWTVTDRDIIVSTHSDHIRQILRARAGCVPTLGSKIAAAGPLIAAPAGADAILLAQPADVAAMFQGWLAYLAKSSPDVLKPEWWQIRQRQQAGRASLGFGMAATRPTDVIVVSTFPGSPAHGKLQAGDRILKADGVPLDPNNPRASLKQLVANRKRARAITLTVERAGSETDVEIPLPEDPPAFDPVGAIRQISKLLQPFAAASYSVRCSAPDRFSARVVLRAVPVAASAPASAPITRPATAPASTSVVPPTTIPSPPAAATTSAPATPATRPASVPVPAASQPR